MSGYARVARALGATCQRLRPRRLARRSRALRDAGRRGRRRPRRRQRAAGRRRRGRLLDGDPARTTPSASRRASAGCRPPARGPARASSAALRRTIAVAGAHGKTTTSSMVAHALLGAAACDPGYLIGGALRTTGRNADWGAGEWLVVEADESDRSMLELARRVAVVTNVELDHHATYGSLAELARRSARSSPARREAVAVGPARAARAARRRAPRSRFDVPDAGARAGRLALRLARATTCALRGARARTTRATPPPRWRPAGSPAPTRPRRSRRCADFAGAGRRFERARARRRRARVVVDDYAHHPTEVAATIAAARTLGAAARRRRLPAAPVLAHAAPRARVRRARSRAPTSPSCSTSTRRASAPRTSPA